MQVDLHILDLVLLRKLLALAQLNLSLVSNQNNKLEKKLGRKSEAQAAWTNVLSYLVGGNMVDRNFFVLYKHGNPIRNSSEAESVAASYVTEYGLWVTYMLDKLGFGKE